MFRLKVTLTPKKKAAINTNYRSRLNNICRELIRFNRRRYLHFNEEKNKRDQLYFSPLFCRNYEVIDGKIIFKDDINWYISCPSYSTVLDLIQGFHCKGIIKLERTELEVVSLELNSINKDSKLGKSKRSTIFKQFSDTDNEEIALMR